MRRIVMTMLLFAAAVSCERVDVDYSGGGIDDSGRIMALAVEYPQGYEWKTGGSPVGMKLVVYNDWEPELSVDVSEEAHVSGEPDMHRLIDGNLYSEFSTTDQTIIGRNGEELFRYSGREAIADMAVLDTSVFTLGIKAESGGFAYRRNGVLILVQEKGILLSKFHYDGGKLCFAYKIPLGSEYRYYVVRNEAHEQVVPPSDMKDISSMRLWKGEINYLGFSTAVDSPLWQVGPDPYILEVGKAMDLKACSLMMIGGELFAHACYSVSSPDPASVLWKKDTLKYSTLPYGSVYSVCEYSKEPCFVCTKGGRSSPVTVFCGERQDSIPPNLAMLSPDAFCCDKKGYYLALNDRENGNVPVVMHGTDTVRFGFNGYFTCFSPR